MGKTLSRSSCARHNRTFLRSLGSDAVLFLLHDRWDLRAKVLAARRSRVTDLEA